MASQKAPCKLWVIANVVIFRMQQQSNLTLHDDMDFLHRSRGKLIRYKSGRVLVGNYLSILDMNLWTHIWMCTVCAYDEKKRTFSFRASDVLRSLRHLFHLMFIGTCTIVIVEEWKTSLMSLAILFHFICAQHVSDINISIIRSLRLCWWITTSAVLFSVRCVLELCCGWF